MVTIVVFTPTLTDKQPVADVVNYCDNAQQRKASVGHLLHGVKTDSWLYFNNNYSPFMTQQQHLQW